MVEKNPFLYFSASIRVVKSIVRKDYGYNGFGFDTVEVIKEKMIEAETKAKVKEKLAELYPQFFQNGKVYEKETKDQAQFFYVIIKQLSNYEVNKIHEGNWTCDHCKEVHDNKYVYPPKYSNKPPFTGKLFCDNQQCFDEYKTDYYKDVDMPDDEYHVNSNSLNYIYKCTEKSTGKSYIGKTRNAPFFRWWNHLTHSSSPFGMYLRTTSLCDWTFEVLEILPSTISDAEVFKIETKYILQFDSINNGFNSVVSAKSNSIPSGTLFDSAEEAS